MAISGDYTGLKRVLVGDRRRLPLLSVSLSLTLLVSLTGRFFRSQVSVPDGVQQLQQEGPHGQF